MVTMDNNTGDRRQSPPTAEANEDLIGMDFQELGEFYSKNNAFLRILC